MDAIKARLARISQQLAGLSASQKMLTASLVAIMVMTLLWWGKFAGNPEMEPVLNQSLAADDIAIMTRQLDARGLSYQIVGDRLMVPADKKMQILAELGFAQVLPSDTSAGFNEIIQQMSPFDSQSQKDRMWLQATQVTLAQVIRGFPNVTNATVMIDPRSERRIEGSVTPSASIIITTRNGAGNPKQLATAAADVVAGSQSGLKPSRISVVINGMTVRLSDDNDQSMARGSEFIDLTRSHEKYFRDKVEEQLSFIRGVMVSVTVKLNTKQVSERQTTVDPKNFLQKETRVETENTESSTGGPGGEPGVQANTSAQVPQGVGASGGVSTTEKTRTDFMVESSKKDTTTLAPAGDAQVVAASVRVPRSYFVNILRARNKGADPDDVAVEAFITSELPKIRDDVKMCTNLIDDDSVRVETYADLDPSLDPSGNPMPEIASSGITVALGGHTREIAIGGLALVSLFMLMMMVRKSQPAPLIASIPELGPTPNLGGVEEAIGTVGDGNPMLDAVELDEDAVKTQQMMEQVSNMVKENPDAAASLVKRWLNRN